MLASVRRETLRRSAATARRRLATSAPESPSGHHGLLPGTSHSAITPKLHFFDSVMGEDRQIPTYRVIDNRGELVDGGNIPEVR